MGGDQPDSTTTTMQFPAWLTPYMQRLAGMGEQQLNQGAPTPFAGTRTAGFTPNQTAGQNFATDFAGSFSDRMAPANDALTRAMSGTNPFAKYVENGNPFLDKMVKQAQGSMADVFNRDVMTNIRDEAIGSGQQIGAGQSTYEKGVDLGTSNLVKGMGDVATNMYGSAYEGDMNRLLAGEELASNNMIRGLSLTPSMMQTNLMPAQIYSGVGGEQQNMDQRMIDEAIQKHYEPYTNQMSWLTDMMKLFTGMSPGGTSTTTDNSAGPNNVMGALGAGGMGYGMASMLGVANPAWGLTMALPYLFN